MSVLNGRDLLKAVVTDTDFLEVDPGSNLVIDGIPAADIINNHGSPLFVIVEKTLRTNFRRCKAAFAREWPGAVEILYAIKANNNLAVRAIIASEGGGGDCYGMGELTATFEGGADSSIVAMNGSLKSYPEILKGVELGVAINLDAEDEIEKIERACEEAGKRTRVNIRLKILDNAFKQVGSDYVAVPDSRGIYEIIGGSKWGFSIAKAAEITRRLASHRAIDQIGFSYHLGRFSVEPEHVRLQYKCLARDLRSLCDETGFWPKVIDIGGGMPRRRDPESRTRHLQELSIELFAQLACDELRGILLGSRPVPDLWVEPGRYIVGNAGLLLATVGSVKQDLGRRWVNLDTSTNVLMRIEAMGSQHYVVPAVGMDRPWIGPANIVGVTCVQSLFAGDTPSPDYRPGDLVAILDAGMYAEAGATQFNGIPRPATVLVGGGGVEVIKLRETVEDVFRLHRIPKRLRNPENR